MSRRRRKAAYAAAAAAAMKDGGPTELGSRAAAIPGLIRDTLSGAYPDLPKKRLALMALALLYLVSPIDLLPEAFLTIPGLFDDVAVAGWLVAATLGATAGYRTWRANGPIDPAATTSHQASTTRTHEVIQGEVISN